MFASGQEMAMSDPMLHREFPALVTSPRLARHALTVFVEACGRGDLSADAGVLVTELIANAVKYGVGPIKMRAHWLGPVLRVVVGDQGDGGVLVREPDETGGRGLPIVAALSTRWGSMRRRGRGKDVWFELG